jgi:cation diffusion facilitator CzcD-associated flavoprotein CzcO
MTTLNHLQGGFRFIANNYGDLLTNEEANAHAYEFWARKQRARIHDKEVADILVPLEAPHAFGGKRPSLEQDYYDLFNKPSVHIVDVRKNNIKEIVPQGIVTEDGKLHEVDVIALATGFDSVTGGLKDIKLRGDTSKASPTLAEYWNKNSGVYTYLGMAVHGYPNFFFTYGPQAPTAFSNGPSCVEPQVDWIVDVLVSLRHHGAARIEAKKDAEQKWREDVMRFSSLSLRHTVPGWYNGANIPGKTREPLNYAGGLVLYQKTIRDVLQNNLEGFDVMTSEASGRPYGSVYAHDVIEDHETLWKTLTGWLAVFG